MEKLENTAKRVYRYVNQLSGGALTVIRSTLESFSQSGAPEAAASISYYAIFSLFPLLILLITIGSYFLASDDAVKQLISMILNAIPVSRSLIERNIEIMLAQRGAISLIGLLALLWSGTGVFTMLVVNINRSFSRNIRPNFIRARLSALAMVVALTVLLGLAFFSKAFFSLLPRLTIPAIEGFDLLNSLLWKIMSIFVPWLLIFAVFLGLYRFLPNTVVFWRNAFWGALVAASLWEIATGAFTWYLGSGMARYEIVYGSLGAVVALMFYIYLTSWIALFGAHLAAAIQRTARPVSESKKLRPASPGK